MPLLRPDQHVVSRVALARFAERVNTKGEKKVQIFSRDHPKAKPTRLGPSGCGKFRHYVRFASKSSEQFWSRTETLPRPAADAADACTFYEDPAHLAAVRNAIILHFVRSIPALILSDRTWRAMHDSQINKLLSQRSEALFWLHKQRFGWVTHDESHLRIVAEDLIGSVAAQLDRGIYFRVSSAERYHRYCEMLREQPVELRCVPDGELLIGDVPALALREGHLGSGPFDGPGLADCDELVLPLGPRLLAVLGTESCYTEMTKEDVDRFNAAQVRAAADYVYMRPGSGLEQFARTVDPMQRPNKIPDHLRQGLHPRHLDPLAGH